jgi:hypothetical protein
MHTHAARIHAHSRHAHCRTHTHPLRQYLPASAAPLSSATIASNVYNGRQSSSACAAVQSYTRVMQEGSVQPPGRIHGLCTRVQGGYEGGGGAGCKGAGVCRLQGGRGGGQGDDGAPKAWRGTQRAQVAIHDIACTCRAEYAGMNYALGLGNPGRTW